MNKELTWELIDKALEEKKLEILEDYKYLEWMQNEMKTIRKKYETDKEKNITYT